MKYIIDIPDNVKKIVYFHVGNANAVWTTTNVLDDLELLTTEYINENFSDLQDEAYQRGLNDGKEYGLDESDMREAVSYQRGLEDGKAVREKGCKGCEYEEVLDLRCNYCANRYPNQWTAKQTDDEIKVGDEVNWAGDCFIVTRIFQPRNMKEQCDGIDNDGCVYHDVLMDDLEKTGRHSDIMKLLEEMRT
jgi:hypothetical protein